jgi:hypothetical protein
MINIWLLIISILILAIWFFIFKNKKLNFKTYEIDEAKIGIGNSTITIKPDYLDIQIAYKLWIELSTRKIGLTIDFENDFIIEIYNSWYEFFKIARELLKDIPVRKIKKNENTKKLIEIAIYILNECLRPHLTIWKAKFRRWYQNEEEKEENKFATPQEIQKKYHELDNLIKDLTRVNTILINYKDTLKKITMTD